MKPSENRNPARKTTGARGRSFRLGVAILTVALAHWGMPRRLPYFDPAPLAERWAAALGRALPLRPESWLLVLDLLFSLLLGIVAYLLAGSRSPVPASTEAAPGRSWSARLWTGRWVPAVLIAALVGLAYANRFMDDDAYISFRYAHNLVEGAGLVYNPGERVEGYTNFLWVLWIAAGMALGVGPVIWVQMSGLLCFAATLAITYRVGRLVLPAGGGAVIALLLVGTQYSVLCFATGGLETSLQTMLVALGFLLVIAGHLGRSWSWRRLLALSLTMAAGVLTRMDFALFGLVFVVAAGLSIRSIGGHLFRTLAWLVLPATHFAWSRRLGLPLLLALWMAYGSMFHYRTFAWVPDRAEPVAHLRWQTTGAGWADAGAKLRELFGGDGVVIATTVAGILPYEARLTTIDMHGLTDSHIARHGQVVSNRPGHKRFAGWRYLRRRGVNLVIGHPKFAPPATLGQVSRRLLRSCVQSAEPYPEPAVILAIPVAPHRALLAWYLTPHPAIDAAIAARGWRRYLIPPAGGP